MENPLTLGALIQRYRRASGLTQEELAERAGVSVHTISNLERGVPHAPRKDTIRLLADALGLSATVHAAFLAATGTQRAAAGNANHPSRFVAPDNLPVPPTRLLGRERDVAAVCALLTDEGALRLLTLVGPGGVGKTRLALEAARVAVADFADGVCFVPLAPLREASLLPAAIAGALGLRENSAASVEEVVRVHLRERQTMLLLDNFEHLAAAAPIVADLLAACPRVRILATSRAALRIRGEWRFEVEPLAVPEAADAVTAMPSGDVLDSPAVALFIERARAVRPDLELTPAALRAAAEICRRLDGLPLAIELAAARCQVLSPHALLTRLDARLPVLVGGERDLPARQRALRDTLAWSYDLLPSNARTLFRRLAAFANGFALDDVEATYADFVCEGDEAPIVESLSTLVEHHLVRCAPDGADGAPRFAMLETIREYAVVLLDGSGEAEAVRLAHADHYVALAEAAQHQLRGPSVEGWLNRLREQHDNLRQALTWLSAREEAETGLRMSGALWRYWYLLGTLSEGRGWLERFLAQPAAAQVRAETYSTARALALHGMGALCALQGDYAHATPAYDQALTIRRARGDRQGVAATLNNLGSLTLQRGESSRAEALFTEALDIKRALGHRRGIASSLGALASVALYRGEYEHAERLNLEAIEVCHEVGDQHDLASALNDLANVAYRLGECTRARELGEQSLAILQEHPFLLLEAFALATLGSVAWAQSDYRRATSLLERCLALRLEIGQVWGVAEASMLLGRVQCFQGAYKDAEIHCREALATYARLSAPRDMAECLEALAAIATLQGQVEQGAERWGAAEALRSSIGTPLPPVEQRAYSPVLEYMRAVLGGTQYDARRAKGSRLASGQALLAALFGAQPLSATM